MGLRSLTPMILAALMLMMSWGALIDAVEMNNEDENTAVLETVDVVFAPSNPGHTVFAQYITSDNCGYCYQYGSPAHNQAKNSLPDNYVYISYHSASYGNTADAESGNIAPIYGVQHLGESGGAPKTSFGDATLNTGCGSNTCWDSFISSGGNMHSTAADYSVSVAQSDNGDGTTDVTVAASYTGSGTAASSIKLYAAVTEKVCNSHAYSDGSKGHNCWEAWLLDNGNYASNSGNTGGSGFETISLASGSASKSWTVPNSLVNGGSSNMNTVAALYSGWSTSSFQEDVYAAGDSTMNPLDLSVTDMTITNLDAQSPGFQTGDRLQLDATIGNTGQEDYSGAGQIQFYQISSSGSENPIGQSVSLNNLVSGATQSVSAEFDTSSIQMNENDPNTVFRVKLSGTVGESMSSNNMQDAHAPHDLLPDTSKPISAGSTQIERGGTLDFEVTGISNDNVDDMSTMSAEFETREAGVGQWTGAWVSGGNLMGAGGGNERFVFTVSPPNSAGSGDYDARARLIDARGQIGDWSPVNSNAFSLVNGLPMVVTSDNLGEVPSNCPTYPGQPTVKVETIERIDVAGLICDAETPLDQLVISSTNPAFRAWDPTTGEIEVKFDTVNSNPQGEVITQPLQVNLHDGEDSNSGTLNIMVIENGAPRWSSLPTQSFNEGSGSSLIMTPFVSDTDTSGQSASPMGLALSVEYISNNSLIEASLNGHTLNIDAVDDDVFGTALVTIRATDADGQFADTELTVIIANVNDAPTLDVSSFDNLMVKVDEEFNFNVAESMSDVDDPVDPINVIVSSDTWKTGSRYNALTGEIKAWFDEEGTHTISIVVRDSHDGMNAYDVTIDAVDNLPLIWSDNVETGDLMINAENIFVGELPTFVITQHSDLVLSDISIEWTICNMDSGICSDFGIENPTSIVEYNFSVVKDGGVLFRDYVKVKVMAVDSDGFDRETSIGMKYDVTEERPEVVDDSTDDTTTTGEETASAAGNAGMVVYGIIGAFIVALLIAVTLGVMLLRGGKEEELGMGYGAAAPMGMPPAPAAGLGMVPDYTQLPAGGNYVTNDSGQTVYLSPDNTDWTMQADNSFVRTR
ncbi:hypothetical protein OAV27_03085 [Euryarchaeota archaeon]|nr:hypothetical protein [Euryarchaeota archaeon]